MHCQELFFTGQARLAGSIASLVGEDVNSLLICLLVRLKGSGSRSSCDLIPDIDVCAIPGNGAGCVLVLILELEFAIIDVGIRDAVKHVLLQVVPMILKGSTISFHGD